MAPQRGSLVAQAWAQQLPVPLGPQTPEAQAALKVQWSPAGRRFLPPVVPCEPVEAPGGSLIVWLQPSAESERLARMASG